MSGLEELKIWCFALSIFLPFSLWNFTIVIILPCKTRTFYLAHFDFPCSACDNGECNCCSSGGSSLFNINLKKKMENDQKLFAHAEDQTLYNIASKPYFSFFSDLQLLNPILLQPLNPNETGLFFIWIKPGGGGLPKSPLSKFLCCFQVKHVRTVKMSEYHLWNLSFEPI